MTYKYRSTDLVSRLTRSVIYKPLAAVLAVFFIPTCAWFESTAGIPLGATAKSFQASAQTLPGCGNRGNLIIQVACVNGVDDTADLDQLESAAVEAYSTHHKLSVLDAQTAIYKYGREDLRSAVRSEMLGILLGIINTPPQERSAHQKRLYTWFETLVKQNEIAEYTIAYQQYRRFRADPCTFELDKDIASQYGLDYNGPAQCAYSEFVVGPPFVPAASYFTAYGITKSYGKPAEHYPNFARMVANTQMDVRIIYGVSAAVGAVGGAAAGIPVALAAKTIFIHSLGLKGAATSLTAAGAAAGTAAIVVLCVAMTVIAIMQLSENQKQVNELNDLQKSLSRAQNNPPDMLGMAQDKQGIGFFKLTQTLVSQTVPDVPSTEALPAHRPTDPVFDITPPGGNPTAADSFTYNDWNGLEWRAETVGGFFKQTCLGSSYGRECPQTDSLTGDIRYTDGSLFDGSSSCAYFAGLRGIPDNCKFTATRFGSNFVITRGIPVPGSTIDCPADPQTGVTPPGTDLRYCNSYVTSEFRYSYNHHSYSMRLSRAPVFAGDKNIHFTWQGPQQQAVVTAAGIPAPDISLRSSLPAGVTFSGGKGEAQFSFEGSSRGTPSTYDVTLQAQNAEGAITQGFTIEIAAQLSITSSPSISVDYGKPVSFLVTTTGKLPMKLSCTPELLFPGLSFHDNGNGTATISGSSTAETDFVHYGSITASNAQGSVTQPSSIHLKPAPRAVITTPAATFTAGTFNSVKVITTGATTPVVFHFRPGVFWLAFQDNGDGTGVLSGLPPANTSGSFTAYLYAQASGERCCPLLNPNFTINVLDQPVFLSPNLAQFSVGEASLFTISTNDSSGSIAEIGTLPQGLQFTDSGNGTATISGTPAVGTGGSQTLQLSVKGATGIGTQDLALQVNEAPRFKTPNYANFYVGQANSFAVTLSGYPTLSSAPVSQKDSDGFIEGMRFTVSGSGLPAGVTYSNLNPEGYNTGTLTLSGTPSSSDVRKYGLTISASNGVGAPATQNFTLRIAAVEGDVNGDGVVNCTDLNLIKASLNKVWFEVGFNLQADINNDGVVNVKDLALAAKHLPAGTVCP